MTLADIQEIVDFMRENGVLDYESKGVHLTLHPSALNLDIDGDLDIQTSGGSNYYESDYENPMLYPDGKDPVIEQRARVEQLREKKNGPS